MGVRAASNSRLNVRGGGCEIRSTRVIWREWRWRTCLVMAIRRDLPHAATPLCPSEEDESKKRRILGVIATRGFVGHQLTISPPPCKHPRRQEKAGEGREAAVDSWEDADVETLIAVRRPTPPCPPRPHHSRDRAPLIHFGTDVEPLFRRSPMPTALLIGSDRMAHKGGGLRGTGACPLIAAFSLAGRLRGGH